VAAEPGRRGEGRQRPAAGRTDQQAIVARGAGGGAVGLQPTEAQPGQREPVPDHEGRALLFPADRQLLPLLVHPHADRPGT